MRICDRCFHRDGSAVGAVDSITFGNDHEIMDVCESCKTDAKDFIKNPQKRGKVGRPPKKKREVS